MIIELPTLRIERTECKGFDDGARVVSALAQAIHALEDEGVREYGRSIREQLIYRLGGVLPEDKHSPLVGTGGP